MPNKLPDADFRWDLGRLHQGIVSLSAQLRPKSLGAFSPVQVYDFDKAK